MWTENVFYLYSTVLDIGKMSTWKYLVTIVCISCSKSFPEQNKCRKAKFRILYMKQKWGINIFEPNNGPCKTPHSLPDWMMDHLPKHFFFFSFFFFPPQAEMWRRVSRADRVTDIFLHNCCIFFGKDTTSDYVTLLMFGPVTLLCGAFLFILRQGSV